MIHNKKASVFIYILILINIALVIWYIVFNNTYILWNKISFWKNSEEVYSEIFDKWNIAIETTIKYNSNWWWYVDGFSCPTNITMSWTLSRQTWISTNLVKWNWRPYCLWNYSWEDIKIFFDDVTKEFTNVYYNWENKDLNQTTNTNINLWTNNIALSSSVSSSTHYSNNYNTKSNDWNSSTKFESYYRSSREWIEYDLWSERSVWKIVIRKPKSTSWLYWNKWDIILKNSSWNEVDRIKINWIRRDTYYEIDLNYRWLSNDVRYITLETKYKRLNISELEVFELLSTWSEEVWEINSNFNDWDDTNFIFDSSWVIWLDNIDDDLNSDNYKVTSIWNTYYANNYQDDDVVSRLTYFWSVLPNLNNYYNIFWNNYKTDKFIDDNINNDDILNEKIWNVSDWYIYIDLFSMEEILYDIKILEFDKNKYKDEFTLLPVNNFTWNNLNIWNWYIQYSSGSLNLSKEKTWNEFIFDFQNKDYSIFLKNKWNEEISYRLTAENSVWKFIYINPIDDSKDWIIEVLSNHMIIWWDKNFIWENFKIVWSK